MKMTIESTTQIVKVAASSSAEPIDCRQWEGTTERGVNVVVLIPRIAVRNGQHVSQFEAELKEQPAPAMEAQAFPLRMII